MTCLAVVGTLTTGSINFLILAQLLSRNKGHQAVESLSVKMAISLQIIT